MIKDDDRMNQIIERFANQPTDYEFQKIAIQRQLLTGAKAINQFQRVEAGALGEMQFAEIMNEFGMNHWHYLQNMWLKEHTTFECDYLLVTSHCIYVFEIKNYFGLFDYQNGQCRSRGVDITYNPINQIHNATVHLKNLLKAYSYNIPVKGVLVFIGEHNKVRIHDEIDYIDIITRNEIYSYIQNIRQEEKGWRSAIDVTHLLNYLEQFEVPNPYLATPYMQSDIKTQHTGIFCDNCSTRLAMTRKDFIECSCGYLEYREHLIFRTICEYGVLTHGANFIISDVQHLLGARLSRQYLTKILPKYFNHLPDSNVLSFKNYSRPMHKLSKKIPFKQANRMILPHTTKWR